MQAHTCFQRREDYVPPKTPAESRLRKFKLSCLNCNSYQVQLVAKYDEDAGQTFLVLICQKCRANECVEA
jgi:hypothetical protein